MEILKASSYVLINIFFSNRKYDIKFCILIYCYSYIKNTNNVKIKVKLTILINLKIIA